MTVHKFSRRKNNFIVDVAENSTGELPKGEFPKGEGWQPEPKTFTGNVGDHSDRLEPKTGRRLTDAELVKLGKLVDDKGVWYDKETKERKIIRDFGIEVNKNLFTKEKPLENEPYQLWDEKKQQWVIDTEKKEIFEKEQEIAQTQQRIVELENEAVKRFMNVQLGIDVEENQRHLQEYKMQVQELTPQVATLKSELQVKTELRRSA